MPPHVNDHIPVPVNSAIIMTSEQFNDLQAFLAELHAKRDQQPANALNDEQFADLRKLLQPGAELSALMLADYKAQRSTTGPTTRSLMAEGAVEAEWRSPDQINRGIPFDANRNEVNADRTGFDPNPMNPTGESERQRVDRQAREQELHNPAHQTDRQFHGLEPGPQNLTAKSADLERQEREREQAERNRVIQGETERARVEQIERESAVENNRLV